MREFAVPERKITRTTRYDCSVQRAIKSKEIGQAKGVFEDEQREVPWKRARIGERGEQNHEQEFEESMRGAGNPPRISKTSGEILQDRGCTGRRRVTNRHDEPMGNKIQITRAKQNAQMLFQCA